jgi:hypothetical protein
MLKPQLDRSGREMGGYAAFVLTMLVWGPAGCALPSPMTGPNSHKVWYVVLDEGRFFAFRAPEGVNANSEAAFPSEIWAVSPDARWLPMVEFEPYAIAHLRERGTFVVVARVGSDAEEWSSVSQVLGRLGIPGMAEKESLKERVRRGENAKMFLRLLPDSSAQ